MGDTTDTNVGALNIVMDNDGNVHYLLCLLGTLLLGIRLGLLLKREKVEFRIHFYPLDLSCIGT